MITIFVVVEPESIPKKVFFPFTVFTSADLTLSFACSSSQLLYSSSLENKDSLCFEFVIFTSAEIF